MNKVRVSPESTFENVGISKEVLSPCNDPIRIINFLEFRKLKKFPRFPDNKSVCTDVDQVDFSKSFLIFLSHCWLRGSPKCEDWDGLPNPDNIHHDKYKLVVEAVEKIWGGLATEFEECYIWIDYGCINQNGDPAGELRQLDKIVQRCDCILTVVVDNEWKEWRKEYTATNDGLLLDYKAKAWINYLSRAWCRVEMLYAANIPLHQQNDTNRIQKFKSGLRGALESDRRAHLLYGTLESQRGLFPGHLCALQHSYLLTHNPANGFLSVESDRIKIQMLMDYLLPYITKNENQYIGDANDKGHRHGTGKLIQNTGLIYDGTWDNDKPHGKCKITWPNGDVYIGDIHNGTITGKGTCYYSSGNIETGNWINGVIDGKGEYFIMGFGLFIGDFCKGVVNGYGTTRHDDGTVLYTGYYENGMPMIKGSVYCPWFCCKFYTCFCFKIIKYNCFCKKYNPQETTWYVAWRDSGLIALDKLLCGIFGWSNGGEGILVNPVPNVTDLINCHYIKTTEEKNQIISESIHKEERSFKQNE